MNSIKEKDWKFFETIRGSVMENLSQDIKSFVSPNQNKPRVGELHRNLVTFSFKKFMKKSPYYRVWPNELENGTLSLSIEILKDLCEKGFHQDFMKELENHELTKEFEEMGFEIYPNIRMHNREIYYGGINAIKKEIDPYYIDMTDETIQAGKTLAIVINKTFPIVKDLIESKYVEFKKL